MTHPLPSRADVLIDAPQLNALLTHATPPVILAVHNPDPGQEIDPAPGLPGAIDTCLGLDFASPGGGRAGSRPLPEIAELQRKVRAWGINQDSEIIVYDHDGGLQAARAWWVLRWAGLSRVRVLDGGFAAWQNAGLAVQRGPTPITPGNASLSAGHMPQLDEDQAAALARSGVLLDTRIRPNYEGGPALTGQAPRGHIPGAISLPAPDQLNSQGNFLDDVALLRQFNQLGVQADRPVGVYCGAGVSAAHAVLTLACMGISAPMYVGSWSAWSADPERPVARGSAPG